QCDGERPRCGACVKRREPGIDCEYPVRQGAVSRYSDLKQTFGKLERENREFRELFAYLRERPEHEAFEVYRRLRTTTDPLGTLQFVRDADALLAMPAANSCSLSDRRAAEIEAEALASSPIKVPSRPWTSVAGDGLVSNLVSSFFKWDHPFMIPFIDQELFVRDMRGGEGPHCSAFLVNAICTLRSIMSDTARQYKQITASDLTASFLSEAQMHREREAGKVSITTVQALYLLFLVSCCDGTNRAGSLFRFASLNMLQRLNPERVVARLNDDIPHEAEKKRALSRLLWGMFLVESIVSSAYLKPPPLSPPSFAFIPDRSGMHVHNLDVLGAPFTTNSVLPPLVPGSEQAAYQAGVLLYNVMMYNVHPRGTVGSEWDMRERRALFSRLGALENSMVPRLGYRENPVPQTLHLKTLMNMVAYNIIRPLHPSTVIQTGYTARTILLELCAIDVEIIET
ncbi:nitrogen assimilation transcription factor nirA, partial [Podospora australis]